MTGIHLPGLRAHLIIFAPILLCPNTVEMTCTFLVVRTVQVHTFIDVVVNMEGVNREASPWYRIFVLGKMFVESIHHENSVRASWVIGDEDCYSVKASRSKDHSKPEIQIGLPTCHSVRAITELGCTHLSPRNMSTDALMMTCLHCMFMSPVSSFARNFFRSWKFTALMNVHLDFWRSVSRCSRSESCCYLLPSLSPF